MPLQLIDVFFTHSIQHRAKFSYSGSMPGMNCWDFFVGTFFRYGSVCLNLIIDNLRTLKTTLIIKKKFKYCHDTNH